MDIRVEFVGGPLDGRRDDLPAAEPPRGLVVADPPVAGGPYPDEPLPLPRSRRTHIYDFDGQRERITYYVYRGLR